MSKSTPKDNLPANFEQGLQELNELVSKMEQGDAPLQDMLSSYQRGTVLLKFCESALQAAQDQILQLDGSQLKPLQK